MNRRIALCALAIVLAACQPSVTPAPLPSGRPIPIDPTVIPARTAQAPAEGSATGAPPSAVAGELKFTVQTYRVPAGAHPHDVAPASDGGVWYTGQRNGTLGWLDPATGDIREVPLGNGSAPHGVISGPDGAAWVTDPGLDAIVRVEPGTFQVTTYPLPAPMRGTALHTGVFDHDGVLWFTGQRGSIGWMNPLTHDIGVVGAPRGAGPYGITVTPSNDIYFASLQGSYLGAVEESRAIRVLEPPTSGAGVRRAWSDSTGRIWITEWNAGKLGMYDPATGAWREWELEGGGSAAYAIYVDELDAVWLSDFGSNSILRFDPVTETFLRFESTRTSANVRQLLGRPGEVWGAESGVDRLIVIRYGPS